MTEKHEVTLMIEDIEAVLEEVRYEAATKPGEEIKFTKILVQAASHLGASLIELKKAEDMLFDY